MLVWLLAAGACTSREPTTAPDMTPSANTTSVTTPSSPETAAGTTPQSGFRPAPPPDATTVCDRFVTIGNAGTIASTALTEASGVVASRAHPGVLWLHNDSGGDAAVYATDATGATLGTWLLDGVFALDWEDIAIGPGPEAGIDYLYVGDIGDNLAFRPDVTVYRFAEPDPTSSGVVIDAVALRLGYPSDPIDAEAMFVDPIDGDLVIITKTNTGESRVLRASATSVGSDPIIPMLEIATLDLGLGVFATAADISPDGTMIAVRGYEEVFMWPRGDRDLASAFTTEPCSAPSPVETQGEALTFSATGDAYVTVSEGTNPTIWRVGG